MNPYDKEVVEPGDRASKIAKDVCVASYNNNTAAIVIPRQPGNFRGAVDFVWARHILEIMIQGKMSMTIQNDGAGGKPQFFSLIGTERVFYNLSWEILVMVIDDIARGGGYPVIFLNDANVKKATNKNFHLIEAMFAGLGDALRCARQINITGEFAIMKHSVTAFCDKNMDKQLVLNWSGAGVGLSHQDKIIDGSRTRIGMPIVGFWEPGYRCNGGTRHTELILAKWAKGDIRNIWKSQEAMEYIEELTIPSVSYAKTLTQANGWRSDGSIGEAISNITLIAHITGGGLKKFKELLPKGIGANLYNMFSPAPVLLQAQELSFEFPDLKISDKEAHTTFHGGCGAVIVCETSKDSEALITRANLNGIKAGIIGETIASANNQIVINSKFLEGGEVIL